MAGRKNQKENITEKNDEALFWQIHPV